MTKKKAKNQKRAISIIEVVVALFILSLVIIPMNRLMLGSVKISKTTDNIFKVTNIASSYMESILNIPTKKIKTKKK
jgi:Tfp pilus assembly protein PilV